MPRPETPQALRDYFHAIDAAPIEEADQCRMHYSCACMVHNGRRAAEMLLAIQKTLGIDGATPDVPPVAEAPAATPAELDAVRAQAADLTAQVEKLSADNDRLRGHIQLLQRQINRLYDRRELSSVLEKLESGKGAPQESTSEPAPPAVEPQPQTAPRTGSSLADMLSVEGAMPVRDDPKPE